MFTKAWKRPLVCYGKTKVRSTSAFQLANDSVFSSWRCGWAQWMSSSTQLVSSYRSPKCCSKLLTCTVSSHLRQNQTTVSVKFSLRKEGQHHACPRFRFSKSRRFNRPIVMALSYGLGNCAIGLFPKNFRDFQNSEFLKFIVTCRRYILVDNRR